MSVRGFSHLNFRGDAALVSSMRQFYVEVLGLDEGPRPAFRSAGHWLYAGGTDLIHLTVSDPDGPAPVPVPPGSCFDHLALACDDLPAMLERLRTHGWAWSRQVVPGSGAVQLFLRDPAGHGVELNFPSGAINGPTP